MVFLWFSHGFPIKTSIFLWFSPGFVEYPVDPPAAAKDRSTSAARSADMPEVLPSFDHKKIASGYLDLLKGSLKNKKYSL